MYVWYNNNVVEQVSKKSISRMIKRGRKSSVTVRYALPRVYFVLGAVICGLVATFLMMNVIRQNPKTAEFWTAHIERGYEHVVGVLTSWIPVSVFELFFCIMIGSGIFLLVRLVVNLCRANFTRILLGALSLGTAAMYILNMYMLSMGFGYFRADMPIAQAGADYEAERVATVARYFLDDYNNLSRTLKRDGNGEVVLPYSYRELSKIMQQEYARLGGDYFFSYTPKGKPIINSYVLSALSITGITFLPVGESTINIAAPKTYGTFTLAHELAHAKGVQREGDANLIAQYILVSSDNDYLRYCGYFASMNNLLAAVELAGDGDEYRRLVADIDALVRVEKRYDYEYWTAQPDIVGEISEFFNNLYLMFNGADNGTGSYDDGEQMEVIPPPVNPDTGEVLPDPDTGEPQKPKPVYSALQKMYFAVYESKFGA